MINVPFFKQDTGYSCGPSVVQMILRFYGKILSEEDLIQILHTRKSTGTKHGPIIDTIRENGLYVYVNTESTTDELRYFVALGYPAIVHFIEPSSDEGHYAVVVDVGDEHVVLNDPWNGPQFKMTLIDFASRWKSEDGDFKQWLLTASDTEFPLGRQYLPQGVQ